jgi:hypothetical protein
VRVAQRLVDVDHLALHGAVAEDDDHGGRRGGQAHDLHAADHRCLGLRADHDRSIAREPREQVGGLVEHLLEAAVGGLEEVADLLGDRLVDAGSRRGQSVDEEPVALVGRDPPRRGVGLHEVALLLEHRHLVAHRGRRHADAGRVGDVGRPDRLRGRDVLLHHGAEDGCLAFVEHLGTPGYRVLTTVSAPRCSAMELGGDHPGGRSARVLLDALVAGEGLGTLRGVVDHRGRVVGGVRLRHPAPDVRAVGVPPAPAGPPG